MIYLDVFDKNGKLLNCLPCYRVSPDLVTMQAWLENTIATNGGINKGIYWEFREH